MKLLWYPGSAAAAPAWIKHLNKLCGGAGLITSYTDMNDFDWNAPSKSVVCSGFETKELISNLLNGANKLSPLSLGWVNVLVVSRHPGMHSTEEIVESQILQAVNPKIFIYRETNDTIHKTEAIASLGYTELWLNEGEHLSYKVFIQEQYAENAIKQLLELSSNPDLLNAAIRLPRQPKQ